MSLPETVHATLTPSFKKPFGEFFVASLEEMSGIVCSADTPQAALDELEKVVANIQEKAGGSPVEVIAPPYISLEWQQFVGGVHTNTIKQGSGL